MRGADIAGLRRNEILAGGPAGELALRLSETVSAHGRTLGARRIDALGAGASERAVEHAAALAADAGDVAGELARAGDLAP